MNPLKEQTATPDIPVSAPEMSAMRNARGTVLLVEDDRSIRRYLEVILQRAGYSVIAAADGLEAMKAALTAAPDAVVTDAMLPHLSGYELCRFLRRHPKLSDLPVILLSGLERADAEQEASDRPDVYLAKPVRPEELTGCLARLLLKAA
ncbi:MAG TPA: response regulator [Pyrinomonadaceae bacterium]|jgi:CheY-like chemotaxis protein